jgi:hypothetical protein
MNKKNMIESLVNGKNFLVEFGAICVGVLFIMFGRR